MPCAKGKISRPKTIATRTSANTQDRFGTTIPKDVVNRIFGFFIPGERYEVTWSRTSHHMAGQHHG